MCFNSLVCHKSVCLRVYTFAFVCEICAFRSFHVCIPGWAHVRLSFVCAQVGRSPRTFPSYCPPSPPLVTSKVVTKENLVHPHPLFCVSGLKENKEYCFTVNKNMVPTGLFMHRPVGYFCRICFHAKERLIGCILATKYWNVTSMTTGN